MMASTMGRSFWRYCSMTARVIWKFAHAACDGAEGGALGRIVLRDLLHALEAAREGRVLRT